MCIELKSIEGTTVIDVPRLSVSGLLQLNDMATVGNLSVGVENAKLSAEFSTSGWAGSLEKEPSAVVRLPFATIPKFNICLSYSGKLVSLSESTIAMDEFQGSANTTLSDISKHYVAVVKGRIPYLALAKTEVCGANMGDSVGMMAGTVLTHTSVVGATVGVASRDLVGSTLTSGKEARGASASDKYQFGDLSRGVVSSVKHAAKAGSEMRGDDSYHVGDFTAGTAKKVGAYTSENRCRLAGVGGSVAGMAAGAALLGPVGFVAGSMLGGSAAKSSMAAVTGDPKMDPKHKDTAPQQQQPPDLLSFDYPSQAPTQSVSSSHNHTASTSIQQPSQQQNRSGSRDYQYPAQRSHNHTTARAPTAAVHPESTYDHQGYRFGDVSRGIVARGKKADGRDENSGYKFGDFTRGLFK